MTNAAITNQPTAILADLTITALTTHRYSEAVSLLNELCRRDDNAQMFLSASSYRVPVSLLGLVQDRIDQVNAKAE